MCLLQDMLLLRDTFLLHSRVITVIIEGMSVLRVMITAAMIEGVTIEDTAGIISSPLQTPVSNNLLPLATSQLKQSR